MLEITATHICQRRSFAAESWFLSSSISLSIRTTRVEMLSRPSGLRDFSIAALPWSNARGPDARVPAREHLLRLLDPRSLEAARRSGRLPGHGHALARRSVGALVAMSP
jgi:hypothetical protein